MKVIILSGGFGTRLREVIKDTPKPLSQVGGRPFLEYLILQLVKRDIKKIILSVGYKREMIKSYFGIGDQWDVQITYSEEDIPLGTGGALKKAAQLIDDKQFVVMNGDSFLDIDFAKFINFHKSKQAMATLALAYVEDVGRYGKVEIDGNRDVQRFIEKGASGEGFINGGIYIFNRNVIDIIPDGNVSIEKDILPLFIGRGLYAMPVNGFFVDIGIPESYLKICRDPWRLLGVAPQKNSEYQKI